MQMRAGVLIVSDKGSSGERADKSGPAAKEVISQLNLEIVKYEIVPDEAAIISRKLIEWCEKGNLDLILTSGGTGLSSRDVTPEATLKVLDKTIPGLTEAMRIETMKKKPEALLSRAVAGSRGSCLIINMPGSPRAGRECLEVIMPVLPHALDIIGGNASECGGSGGC